MQPGLFHPASVELSIERMDDATGRLGYRLNWAAGPALLRQLAMLTSCRSIQG